MFNSSVSLPECIHHLFATSSAILSILICVVGYLLSTALHNMEATKLWVLVKWLGAASSGQSKLLIKASFLTRER